MTDTALVTQQEDTRVLLARASRRSRRARKASTVTAVVLVILGLFVYLDWRLHRPDPSKPHGDPDPGGRRLAYIQQVARHAVPDGAVTVNVRGYTWDLGGCDGGPAGWTPASVDYDLRPADGPLAAAALLRMGWRRHIPAADKPGDPPSVRLPTVDLRFDPPRHDRFDAFATVERTDSGWVLDVSALPAVALGLGSC